VDGGAGDLDLMQSAVAASPVTPFEGSIISTIS
jgi:hypothetical protein